jgi:hypothetical protein
VVACQVVQMGKAINYYRILAEKPAGKWSVERPTK